jgi:hypothetical protein
MYDARNSVRCPRIAAVLFAVSSLALLAGAATLGCSGEGSSEPQTGGATLLPEPDQGATKDGTPAKSATSTPGAPATSPSSASTTAPPGGSKPPATSAATCATSGAKATNIATNHTSSPHTLPDIAADDFAKGATSSKTYALTMGGGSGGGGGGGPHTHTLTLSAADRATLAMGQPFTKTSSPGGTNGHTHAVTLGCK